MGKYWKVKRLIIWYMYFHNNSLWASFAFDLSELTLDYIAVACLLRYKEQIWKLWLNDLKETHEASHSLLSTS